jgi:hypothetical protein
VSDPPLVPGPIYGLRTWEVETGSDGERLTAPQRGTAWPPGAEWLTATCPRADGHRAPAPDCECGIHALHPTLPSARRVLAQRRVVPGIVEAEGQVELHDQGFRSERGRPHALVLAPGRNGKLVRRLAETYAIPVVEVRGPEDLVAWCRERGLGLDEGAVLRLLGPGAADERRRRRRRDLRRFALWFAVVLLALVVALVVLGDPASGPVCGRFCER